MIKESGRVVAIEKDCLWVETIRQSTCSSCSAQSGCGHGILNKIGSGRRHHVRVLLRDRAASDFAVNDQVDISVPEQVLVTGSLIVYLLPLLSLLLGALLASSAWPGDAAAVAGAVAGFAIGVAAVKYHAFINRNNLALQPTIIGRQTPPSIQPQPVIDQAV